MDQDQQLEQLQVVGVLSLLNRNICCPPLLGDALLDPALKVGLTFKVQVPARDQASIRCRHRRGSYL